MKTPKKPSTTNSTLNGAKKSDIKAVDPKQKKGFDDDDDDDFDNQIDDLGFEEINFDDDDDY